MTHDDPASRPGALPPASAPPPARSGQGVAPSPPPTAAGPRPEQTHPSLDDLADLDADVLDVGPAARLRRHVQGCDRCGATLQALAAVTAELSALPPPPMPPLVLARVNSTLAGLPSESRPAERTPAGPGLPALESRGLLSEEFRGGSGGPAYPAGPFPVGRAGSDSSAVRLPGVVDIGEARDRRARRARRVTGWAVAGVVVLAGSATAAAVLRGSTAGSPSSASGAAEVPPEDSGGLRPGDTVGPRVDGTPVRLPTYTRSSITGALPDIEQRAALGVIEAAGVRGPAGVMADRVRRSRCTAGLPGSPGDPRAVQQIEFEGSRAYVFVYDINGSRTVYVVSERCGVDGATGLLYRG